MPPSSKSARMTSGRGKVPGASTRARPPNASFGVFPSVSRKRWREFRDCSGLVRGVGRPISGRTPPHLNYRRFRLPAPPQTLTPVLPLLCSRPTKRLQKHRRPPFAPRTPPSAGHYRRNTIYRRVKSSCNARGLYVLRADLPHRRLLKMTVPPGAANSRTTEHLLELALAMLDDARREQNNCSIASEQLANK